MGIDYPRFDKNFYESFHTATRAFRRIPDEREFAMMNHVPMYRHYIHSGQRVLDIGCGSGTFSLYAASRGAIVTGVDLSERAIEENNKAAKELGLWNVLSFSQEDFMQFQDEGTYDVVMLTEVLEHLPCDQSALAKVYTLLNDGGILLMSVPSSNAPLHRHNLRKYGRDSFDERVGHLRRYKPAEIINLVCHSGFQLLEFKLCEGYLRNWLFNDRLGQMFMRFNVWFMKDIVSFIDDKFVTPLFGESDIIIVAKKS